MSISLILMGLLICAVTLVVVAIVLFALIWWLRER